MLTREEEITLRILDSYCKQKSYVGTSMFTIVIENVQINAFKAN